MKCGRFIFSSLIFFALLGASNRANAVGNCPLNTAKNCYTSCDLGGGLTYPLCNSAAHPGADNSSGNCVCNDPATESVDCNQYNNQTYNFAFDSSIWSSSCGTGSRMQCIPPDTGSGIPSCQSIMRRSGQIAYVDDNVHIYVFVDGSGASYQSKTNACRCKAAPISCTFLCSRSPNRVGGPATSNLEACGVMDTHVVTSDCSTVSPSSSSDPGEEGAAPAGGDAECDPNTGANGRVCASNSDCCSGVCAIAGNAPFMTHKDCIGGSCVVGVKFTSGYSGSGPAPVGGSAVTTPQKVCVPSTADAPISTAYQKPPASVQSSIDSALVLPNAGYLKCMLASNDKHRDATPNSCQCAAGYSPMVMSASTYNTITYNLHRDRSRLDALWAQVVDLLARHPTAAEPVQKFYGFAAADARASSITKDGCALDTTTCHVTNLSCSGTCLPVYDATVSPPACVSLKCTGGGGSSGGSAGGGGVGGGDAGGATPTQMYSDQSPPQWKAAGNPNYGVAGSVGDGAGSIGAGQVIACAKTCPSGAQKGSDPNSCVCDNPAQTFDPNEWTCQACAVGAYIPTGQTQCVCPSGYKDISGTCKPDPLSLPEYYPDADNDLICGAGRLPMTYGLISSKAVSSLKPRISPPYTSPVTGKNYPYAVDDGSGLPKYFYANFPHCGCVGHSVNDTSPTADIAVSGTFSSDLYDDIASLGSDGKPNRKYAPVSIAHDGTSDGRLGVLFSTGQSECGCPNINEEMVPASASGITGPYCQSKIDTTDPNLVFSKDFDPVYDAWAVMNPSAEVQGANGIVSTIHLPDAGSPESAAQLYRRGIWKCQNGYTINPDTKKCEFDLAKHMCSGDSPVSAKITGANAAERFSNVVNKKLACCLNQYDSSDTSGKGFLKFDCVENASTSYRDFDSLWTSSDANSDGGQLNAFVLANSQGKELTGFYTLSGDRCNEYSEFSRDSIQPGMVNPAQPAPQGRHANGSLSPDAFEAIGNPLPKSSSAAFSNLVSRLGTRARAPSTSAEKRRCPVLVRAALLTACPSNPQSTSAPMRTYIDPDTKIKHCSMAESMQVHIRIEQVWEIAGTPRMQAVDTVLDHRSASAVSISQIIANKYGDSCPPGSTRQGDTCVY